MFQKASFWFQHSSECEFLLPRYAKMLIDFVKNKKKRKISFLSPHKGDESVLFRYFLKY